MSAVTVNPRPVRIAPRRPSTAPVRRPHPLTPPQAGAGHRSARTVADARARAAARRRALAVRRFFALVVVAGIVLAGVSLFALRSEAAPEPVMTATVVVGPGETVWDIASEYLPAGGSTHAYVAEILAYNDVQAASIAPGAVLQLPRP